VQGLRGMFSGLRLARMGTRRCADSLKRLLTHTYAELAKYQRLLSYSILSLITSVPLASSSTTVQLNEEEEEDTSRVGLLNSEGAWCWREHCDGETDTFLMHLCSHGL
jgi:sorting nexin-9/18/33